MQTEELEFQEWLFKLAERLQITTLQVNNQQDLNENDWDGLLKPLHRVWYDGEIVFYKNRMRFHDNIVKESGLFDDRLTGNP